MKAHLKDYRFFFAVVGLNLLFALWNPALVRLSTVKSLSFLLEVLLIVPPVMVLMGLLDVWVPRRLVERHLGTDAGLLGAGVAMLLGTAAAGPLYAAFPVAVSLQSKGARLANIVIFLGTWATIKIPMIMMESSFISLRFALLRLAFTIPCIIAAGYLMERIIPPDSMPQEQADTTKH
jgi:uncharacterized membrane protein YraQ (UPF0718 family)